MKQILKKLLKKLPWLNLVLFYLWPGFPVYITENMLWLYRWRKPIKPYAFIRVHNEIKTIDVFLKSILPVVKGGVIGFHDSDEPDDETRDYVLAFCEKYPQFTPVHYPHKLSKGRRKDDGNQRVISHKRLDDYYNFVWNQLPKHEWIMKVDCDHVYHPDYVEDLCRLLLRKNDCIMLSRLNIHHCKDDQVYSCQMPKYDILDLQEPGDHWILYNGDAIPKSPFTMYVNDQNVPVHEHLEFVREKNRIYSILSNWHFPYLKSRRWEWAEEDEYYKPYRTSDLYAFRQGQYRDRLPKEMIDEKRILSTYKQLNLEGSRILP